jgi:hypothetical protein
MSGKPSFCDSLIPQNPKPLKKMSVKTVNLITTEGVDMERADCIAGRDWGALV